MVNPGRDFLSKLAFVASLALIPRAALAQPMDAWPGMHPRIMDASAGPFRLLLHELDLTQAQLEQISRTKAEQGPAVWQHMKAAREAQKGLQQLTISGFDAERARQLAAAEANARAAINVIHAETMSRIVAILTPEQRTKLAEVQASR